MTSKTVEAHLGRIFERTGVRSRTELAARAIREAWLDLRAARSHQPIANRETLYLGPSCYGRAHDAVVIAEVGDTW